MDRIVSEDCKGTKNAYNRLTKFLVWQGLGESKRVRRREEKKRWRRKGRKERKPAKSRGSYHEFYLFQTHFCSLFLRSSLTITYECLILPIDLAPTLITHLLYHSPKHLCTSQFLSSSSLRRGITLYAPQWSCSYPFLLC